MDNFVEHLKVKNPNIDVDKLFVIFEKQLESIAPSVGPDNPGIRDRTFKLDCDLNKALIAKVVSEYIKDQ